MDKARDDDIATIQLMLSRLQQDLFDNNVAYHAALTTQERRIKDLEHTAETTQARLEVIERRAQISTQEATPCPAAPSTAPWPPESPS